MMAWRPTSLKAMPWAVSRAVEAMAMTAATRSGKRNPQSRAIMPPMLPPTTASRRSMPRCDTKRSCARTMSESVTMGNARPYGEPVAGLTLPGPVLPLQPPSTLAQITK